jgi:hypothetical protein
LEFHNKLKKVKTDISKSADSMAEEPTVSFSHLAAYFSRDEGVDNNQIPAHGSPSYLEESLHETGVLLRDFLKC